ncbi:MAG: HIT domain-containing protein [Candidatus Paceibacterota bacterium]|jgi:diadenosine tetraphosphate (Ap4A) HIT family hydrolase
MTHVNLDNAGRPGDDTYKKVIEKIAQDKVCPFCRENLEKYHKNPIIRETENWVLTTNMYPYKNTRYHFLLIHKDHIADSSNIAQDSWQELHTHLDWLTKEYDAPGATFMMRCGDTSHTGASVTHLHAHLVVSDRTQNEPVMVRIG